MNTPVRLDPRTLLNITHPARGSGSPRTFLYQLLWSHCSPTLTLGDASHHHLPRWVTRSKVVGEGGGRGVGNPGPLSLSLQWHRDAQGCSCIVPRTGACSGSQRACKGGDRKASREVGSPDSRGDGHQEGWCTEQRREPRGWDRTVGHGECTQGQCGTMCCRRGRGWPGSRPTPRASLPLP